MPARLDQGHGPVRRPHVRRDEGELNLQPSRHAALHRHRASRRPQEAAPRLRRTRVRERIAASAPEARVRWVEPANLHITIWFLGEVREPQVEALVAALQKPLDVRPFSLSDWRSRRLPAIRPAASDLARALWPVAKGLIDIHGRASSSISCHSASNPRSRPYSPHLTIARVKDIRPPGRAAVRRALREDDGRRRRVRGRERNAVRQPAHIEGFGVRGAAADTPADRMRTDRRQGNSRRALP